MENNAENFFNNYQERVKDQAIPKIFTDETLKNEKANLEKLIRDAEKSKIDSQIDLNSANNQLRFAEDSLNGVRGVASQQRERVRYTSAMDKAIVAGLTGNVVDRYKEKVDKAQENVNSIIDKIDEYDRNLITYKKQLEVLEAELQKKPIQRAEERYQKLLAKKYAIKNEKEFLELSKKFYEIEGYKDSEALAKECEELSLKMQYDRLVQIKNRASTEEEYKDLANKFKSMVPYENTAELANECENQYNILKKQYEEKEAEQQYRYALLVQAKNALTTTMDEYQNLANQFRAMGTYKDASKLANECEDRYNSLKHNKEANERRAKERKQERYILIFSIVLFGIIGGLIGRIVNHVNTDIISFIIIGAGYITGVVYSYYVLKETINLSLVLGGLGIIGGGLISLIFIYLFAKTPLAASIILGAIIGIIPGWWNMLQNGD